MAASAEITPIPNGTVTSAQGFSAGGVFIGLKTRGEDKLDLAMLVSDSPSVRLAGSLRRRRYDPPRLTWTGKGSPRAGVAL